MKCVQTSFDHEKAGMEGSCLCIHYSLSLKLFSLFLSFQFSPSSSLIVNFIFQLSEYCVLFVNISIYPSFAHFISPRPTIPQFPPSPSFLTGKPPYFTVPSPEPTEESIREKCIGYVVFVQPILGGRVAGLCRRDTVRLGCVRVQCANSL
jgi:hypothetical protein